MYTAQYFIDKFQAIPEEKWCVGKFRMPIYAPVKFLGINTGFSLQGGFAYCAQGHCIPDEAIAWISGKTHTLSRAVLAESYPEWSALLKMVTITLKRDIGFINNGDDSWYQQATPKQRVLKALEDIKQIQLRTAEEAADVLIGKALAMAEITHLVTSGRV